MTTTKSMLTVSQVAKRLNVHPWTIREMLRNGSLRGYKVPIREWRVSEEDLSEFLRSRSNQGG